MKHGFIGTNLVRDFSSIHKERLLVLGTLAICSFQNTPMPQANAIYFMALVVHQDTEATYGSSNLPVRNRLLEQFRYMIESEAGHEPNAVSSIGGWTHCQIALAFALAKRPFRCGCN